MQLTFGIISALISFWITLIILACFIHFYKIEVLQDKPWYLKWNIIRVFFAALYILCFSALSFAEWSVIGIFQGSSHVVFFNPGVNMLRSGKYAHLYKERGYALIGEKYPFWYLGKDSGWLDKLLLRLGSTFYQVFYFACVALMLLSMVTLYIRYI